MRLKKLLSRKSKFATVFNYILKLCIIAVIDKLIKSCNKVVRSDKVLIKEEFKYRPREIVDNYISILLENKIDKPSEIKKP